jgi:SpoVK/Ycf46/Vps4 family AAA+-type ATPase
MAASRSKTQTVLIKVAVTEGSPAYERDRVEEEVSAFLAEQHCAESALFKTFPKGGFADNVKNIRVEWTDRLEAPRDFAAATKRFLIYRERSTGPEEAGEEEEDSESDDSEGEEESPRADVMALPSSQLDGLWESLIFEPGVKSGLLAAVETSLELGASGVDPQLVGSNRLALLHGPPGTGKTSLCRALANELSIRLTGEERGFSKGVLLEIHSHALVSMWMGESGKLVQRMFERVRQLAADSSTFVVVLMDEVESLTAARKMAGSGRECSDSLQMVNSLLTQLDRVKVLPNVLVLATSNLTGSIDLAFMDRADLLQYVGLPPQAAIQQMLESAVQELVAKDVLRRRRETKDREQRRGEGLGEVAALCHRLRLSGRAVRKLPFLALCRGEDRELAAFLASLEAVALALAAGREDLALSHNTA